MSTRDPDEWWLMSAESTATGDDAATVTYVVSDPAIGRLEARLAELEQRTIGEHDESLAEQVSGLVDSLDETDLLHDDLVDRVIALEARTLGPQAQSLASQVLECLKLRRTIDCRVDAFEAHKASTDNLPEWSQHIEQRLAALERGGDEIDGTDMLHQRVDAMARRLGWLEQETPGVSEAERRGYERGRRDDDAVERRGYERAIADVREWMRGRGWEGALSMFDKYGPGAAKAGGVE